MIIGSPGSGKSTLSRELAVLLDYPVLHLDYIYHIDNYNDIGREELKRKTETFIFGKATFIIDGNYGGTMEHRMQACDTVIFFNLPTEVCIDNVLKRQNDKARPDMAPGFDNSIMDDDFLDYVRDFNSSKLNDIEDRIIRNKHLKVVRLNNYKNKQDFLDSLK